MGLPGLNAAIVQQMADGLVHLVQHLLVKGVANPACISRASLGHNQPSPDQNVQVVRYQAQGQVERLSKLTVAVTSLHENLENAQARRVAERFEYSGQGRAVDGCLRYTTRCSYYNHH